MKTLTGRSIYEHCLSRICFYEDDAVAEVSNLLASLVKTPAFLMLYNNVYSMFIV